MIPKLNGRISRAGWLSKKLILCCCMLPVLSSRVIHNIGVRSWNGGGRRNRDIIFPVR